MAETDFKSVNEKLKEAALFVLQNIEDLDSLGMKKLSKLLYFSDFSYYKDNMEPITNASYQRLDHGPLPISVYDAIEELESEGIISVDKKELGEGIDQWHFTLQKEVEPVVLSDDEKERLSHILSKLGSYSANRLEAISHMDTPWQVTDPEEVISYKLVFYRDEELESLVE